MIALVILSCFALFTTILALVIAHRRRQRMQGQIPVWFFVVLVVFDLVLAVTMLAFSATGGK